MQNPATAEHRRLTWGLRKLKAMDRRFLQYGVRCLVTTTVVIWLAVFAPLTCSYHGFLLRPGASGAMAGMGMGMSMAGAQAMPAMTGMQHRMDERDAATPARGVGFAAASHHTSDGDTGMFSLLLLVVPAAITLPPLAQFHAYAKAPVLTRLHPWPPPEQPPRTV